jgi:hypothetical protein
MNLRFLTLASLLTAFTLAADTPKLPSVAAAKEKQMSGELRKPAEPTTKKKERRTRVWAGTFVLVVDRGAKGAAPGWATAVAGAPCA